MLRSPPDFTAAFSETDGRLDRWFRKLCSAGPPFPREIDGCCDLQPFCHECTCDLNDPDGDNDAPREDRTDDLFKAAIGDSTA
jgi:hypothetical protein